MSEPTATYEWRQLPWRKLEVAVCKLQRRIYKASQAGDGPTRTPTWPRFTVTVTTRYTANAESAPAREVLMTRARSLEEPCAANVTRTVLQTSGGSDPLTEFNLAPGRLCSTARSVCSLRCAAERSMLPSLPGAAYP